MADWHEKLDGFVAQHSEDYAQKRVDYLGVNLGGEEPLFKIYYKNNYTSARSEGRQSSLIDLLRERDMINFLTLAEDTGDCQRYRYDIGLKNRTDENMEALFAWLKEHVAVFSQREDEIRKLAAMRVYSEEEFRLAAMHFLGFIDQAGQVTALKCHYLCWMQKDLSSLRGHFPDDYYLSCLEQSGIPVFQRLCPLVRDVLGRCGGHVFMAGTDYWLTGERKDKIYITDPVFLYQGLAEAFGQEQDPRLLRQLEELMRWDDAHPRFYCAGLAMALDDRDRLTINFYYRET